MPTHDSRLSPSGLSQGQLSLPWKPPVFPTLREMSFCGTWQQAGLLLAVLDAPSVPGTAMAVAHSRLPLPNVSLIGKCASKVSKYHVDQYKGDYLTLTTGALKMGHRVEQRRLSCRMTSGL